MKRYRWTFAIGIGVLASLVFSTSAFADDGDAPASYSRFYNGSFVDVGARAGITSSADADYDGWTLDAGIRHSFPMLLGDTRLAYRYDRLSPPDAFDSPSGAGLLEQHSVGLTAALHPLYLVLLGSGWLSYVISSFYLEAGIGGQYSTLDVLGGDDESDWGFVWTLGTGLDIPLWDPDVGYALWINVLYRFHSADFDREAAEAIDLPLHTGFVGLSFRQNGLLF